MAADSLEALRGDVVSCRRCPRLVAYRERVARTKVARFRDSAYWGRPVPGFGDSRARVLVVGLAPAAHGGNRTGRVFTGDRSGDWLFRALHRARFANQATSVSPGDGLRLRDVYITAAVRCAPPQNHPTPPEFERCRPFLAREVALLPHVHVVVALGGTAWGAVLRTWAVLGRDVPRPRPPFAHGAEARLPPRWVLLGSYHPSQRNTSTGLLREAMLDDVVRRARVLAEVPGDLPRAGKDDRT